MQLELQPMDQVDGSFTLAIIMGYAIIFILVAVPVLLAAIFVGRHLRGEGNRRFIRQGDIFKFQDRGNQITPAIELQPGTYKLQYQFPNDIPVKIDLISLDEGDSETIVVRSASGSQALRIDARGRYAFQVEPVDEQSAWAFEISPLGLPSHHEQ